MQKKEQFKNEILLKMKYHLGKNELAILDEALSESLYQVDIIDAITQHFRLQLPTAMSHCLRILLETKVKCLEKVEFSRRSKT